MSTNNGLLSPRTAALLPPTGSIRPDSFTRLPVQTHFPKPRFSRAASFTARAAENGSGRVASPVHDIAPEMSFYDLLGIPETGTALEIKQAYKQLARKYHPDVSPPDRVGEYTERFIRVQEAYETLLDPRRRALYDSDMAKGLHFAFSARRRYQFDDEEMEGRDEWRNRWQSQLSELKRRSVYKENTNSTENMSWAAQMRKQRNESSSSSSSS
ncbi:hypothetical protein LguiA_002105 [Lonicera macranthoides]